MKLNINEIKKFYGGYKGLGGHGFDHPERVLKMARLICEREGGDIETIEAAALLHDIARAKEDDGKCDCHAEEGAKMAENYLHKISFPRSKIKNVIHCVAVHRFSRGKKAETKEAKIIQDADRLDALGAIIIARVLAYNGLHKFPIYDPDIKPVTKYKGRYTTAINHFYEKILKITPVSFHTKTAQRIAAKRYNFVVNFLKQFKKEWEGKDL
ncbi:MAG: HD domain-containing protein [Patescibacteria group bacterium]